MMDLGTIKRKLERDQYETPQQCANDVRLVWSNCMTYNSEGSDFWLLAKAYSKRFEDRYRKIKAECKCYVCLSECTRYIKMRGSHRAHTTPNRT